MRTYSSIITLLFFVACANATKSVSYSEIVYSLMELNDSNDNKSTLENFKKINLAFNESKENLNKFDAKMKSRCQLVLNMGVTKLQAQGRQLISLEKSKTENLEKQTALRSSQENATKVVADNEGEIRKLREKIREEKTSFLTNEKRRAERYMIFKRLINFLEDELVSSVEQRKTDMTNINVDKSFSSKTSFVQLERIRSDLADISSRSSDPIAKSMITTLLMITQANNRNLFVNNELVEKVKNLISQLMKKEQDSNEAERVAVEKNVAGYNTMIEAKLEESDRKKREELMNVAELASLEQGVRNIENEIKAYTKAQEKQRKKNTVQDQLCQKQDILIKLHASDLASFESQFKELQNNLA